jgi:long-chain acyl-CoA synthetase
LEPSMIITSALPNVRKSNLAGETLGEKFWSAVQARSSKVALRQKEFGVWEEVSWTEYGRQARMIAMALVAEGFKPGDTASILANTRREWCYCDFGVLCAGGVSSGIYPTDAASQVQYLCADSNTSFLFVEDDEQLDKALQVRAALPLLKKIIVINMEGLTKLSDPQIISLGEFQRQGQLYDQAHTGLFEQRVKSRKASDLAILVYTSGTTGRPKGAMLSHNNIRCVLETAIPIYEQTEHDDKMTFLPLCHIAERMLGEFFSLESGSRMNFVENPDTIAENIREIAPTVFLGVPRVWEKFYSAISIRMKEATRFEQWAYKVALGLGYQASAKRLAGQSLGPVMGLGVWLSRVLVLNNIRKVIGVDKMRIALTGAAPISPELIKWYRALGLDMFEGYGMTESTAGGTFNGPQGNKVGTVGKPAPYCELKLSSEGEILMRGDHVFMGYLNQPEKTRETIDADGWLHTGDVGVVDTDGFLKITDRMKDIIITAGGKNITPSELENELKFSPYITDAVVIGDRRAYLTALIMIDHENVEKYAQDLSVPFSNFMSLCRTKEVQELIQKELDRVNTKFARVEQIKTFRLIEIKLTAEDDELTPTMKLKRKFVNEKYKPLIDSMYKQAA